MQIFAPFLFHCFLPYTTTRTPSSFHPHVKKPLPSLSSALKDFSCILVSITWRSFSWFKTSFKDRDGREVKWGSRSLTWPKERLLGVSRILDRQVAIREPQHDKKGAEGFKWGIEVFWRGQQTEMGTVLLAAFDKWWLRTQPDISADTYVARWQQARDASAWCLGTVWSL